MSTTMNEMPFIEKLKYWATTRSGECALVAGEQRYSFAELLHAAHTTRQAPSQNIHSENSATSNSSTTDQLAIIDEPTGTNLVIKFCAAIFYGQTAMVLDTNWPIALRQEVQAAAETWAGEQENDVPGPFLLGLSSGTSGLPKAFVRNATSWETSFANSTEYFGVGTDTVTLAPGPLAASMNLYALGESIYAGSTFVTLPHCNADAALLAIARSKVNRLVLVPTVLELLAARGLATEQSGEEISSILCAGSVLSAATVALARQWAPNAHIQQYYGAAELGFVAASTRECPPKIPILLGHQTSMRGLTQKPQSTCTVAETTTSGVGPAFPGVEISIRDKTGTPLPAGQLGYIFIKSPYVCSGYAWGDDGLAFNTLIAEQHGSSSASFENDDSGQWFTVRDQGHLDPGGTLHLAGRASDMIIVAGTNVYPHHVEQTLAMADSSTGVLTIVVTGIADPLRGQRVVAGIYSSANHLDGDHSATGSTTACAVSFMAALRHAASTLTAQQRPTRYFEISELPLTNSGKISRAILSHWISEGDTRAQRIP